VSEEQLAAERKYYAEVGSTRGLNGRSRRSLVALLEAAGVPLLWKRAGLGGCVVAQVEVLKQTEPGACGYHALHNAVRLALLAADPDERRALGAAVPAFSRAAYWEHFLDMKRHLLERCATIQRHSARRRGRAEAPQYPWHASVVEENMLERVFLDYLLVAHPRVGMLQYGDGRDGDCGVVITALPELVVESLESLVDVFRRCSLPGFLHCFVVGAVTHWHAFVVNRPPERGAPLEVLLADSRNENVAQLDLDAVRRAAQTHPRLRNDFDRFAYVQSRIRSRENVALFEGCATGARDVRSVFLDAQVHALLRSYRRHVSAPLSPAEATLPMYLQREDDEAGGGDAKDAAPPREEGWLQRLLSWLKQYYPPAMLVKRDVARLRNVGARFLSPAVQRQLLAWLRDLSMRLAAAMDADDAVVAPLTEFNFALREMERAALRGGHAA
jgi:hypothetical protein